MRLVIKEEVSLPKRWRGSRGKIGLPGGKHLGRSIVQTEVKVAGVIHLLGRAGKFPTPGANLEGATLLAPDSAEVREDLIRRLVPPLSEGVEKGSQGLGAGHVSTRGLAQGNSAFFEIAWKISRLVGEVEAESQNGEGETTRACDGFDQQPSQLLILPK
jgi:hypothetical protein